MNVKIISVTTHDGKDKSSSSYIYRGIEQGFYATIHEVVIGERMYIMHPESKVPKIHTSTVLEHDFDADTKIHTVKTMYSIYKFLEFERPFGDLEDKQI